MRSREAILQERRPASLSLHSTRVTVATRLARAGISERHAMRFVGHASATIHRVYARLQVDDLKARVQALSAVAMKHRSAIGQLTVLSALSQA